MKISSFKLCNVNSYKDEVEFIFDENLNILIGPNGGGKTNALKTLWYCLERFVLLKYFFEQNSIKSSVKSLDNSSYLLDRNNDSEQSYIEIEIKTDSSDSKNLKILKDNQEDIQAELARYTNFDFLSYVDDQLLEQIKSATEIKLLIKNGTMVSYPSETLEGLLLGYFRTINIFPLSKNQKVKTDISFPLVFLNANREDTPQFNISIQENSLTNLLNNYKQQYNNQGFINSAMIQAYFSQKLSTNYKELKDDGGMPLIKRFLKDQEITSYNTQLSKIGLSLYILEKNIHNYTGLYKKNDKDLNINYLSSGEKAILGIIHGIMAFNISNGVIIIDEPEVHLHPSWQKLLLEILIDLQQKRNIQIIFATHSASFINYQNLGNVIRIYQKDSSSTQKKSDLKDGDINIKQLFQILTTYNNERLFFADEVILVEGIKDKVIFQSILDKNNTQKVFEVIDIGGKIWLKDYKKLCESLDIKVHFIGDRDNIEEMGNEDVKKLFVENTPKAEKKTVKDKKSKDGKSLLEAIDDAEKTKNFDDVVKLRKYIGSRFMGLRPEISDEEQAILDNFYEQKEKGNIYLLRKGEIEDYLDGGIKNKLDKIIDFTNSPDFMSEISSELKDIIEKIISK